ncbi:DUF2069 domain-containing protein [Corticibacter populi]|uniref:DUF2069 domain-containing protein n=1 Tax=Corticibacter populi TaxID=1550736 RepID=A0A3M6QPE6_9BURK|nr:DUF2069 domain-containing protein [Corticibacter populi]RMX04272.1 DUF2069 domain-containing protein [Corticibacter populi]RZS33315.1 putative membrane protein [Corticibacter populi]
MPAAPIRSPSSTADAALPRWIARCRLLVVGAVLALIVLCVGWELFWAPIGTGGSLLALKALPLCLPLGGLLRNRLYTYRWLSLLIWLYFTEGVVRATTEAAPGAWLAALEVLLSLLVFGGCAAYVRLRLRNGQRLARVGKAGDNPR